MAKAKVDLSQFLLALSDLSFLWRTHKLNLWFVNFNKPFNKACLGFGLVKKFETKVRLCIGVCCESFAVFHPTCSAIIAQHSGRENYTSYWTAQFLCRRWWEWWVWKMGFQEFMEVTTSFGNTHSLQNLFLFPAIHTLCFYCRGPVYLITWHCVFVNRLFMHSLNYS